LAPLPPDKVGALDLENGYAAEKVHPFRAEKETNYCIFRRGERRQRTPESGARTQKKERKNKGGLGN
jgi:hypothetical protein